ncbi:hypothetical protein P8452_22578 [Trifolium repens]|nr:hypothetical protein P8452_22578 [Trifolium repens]
MLVSNGKVDGSSVGADALHAQIRAIFYLKFENENSDQEFLLPESTKFIVAFGSQNTVLIARMDGRPPMSYKDACIAINGGNHNKVQHANRVVNSQGSTMISKPKSHGTVSGGLQLKWKVDGPSVGVVVASCTNKSNFLSQI